MLKLIIDKEQNNCKTILENLGRKPELISNFEEKIQDVFTQEKVNRFRKNPKQTMFQKEETPNKKKIPQESTKFGAFTEPKKSQKTIEQDSKLEGEGFVAKFHLNASTDEESSQRVKICNNTICKVMNELYNSPTRSKRKMKWIFNQVYIIPNNSIRSKILDARKWLV